ncbi:hypothetical protein BGX33_007739 [Mortierella sp. NVP41]|nr:hypothetical protein BGX33_007739 [Mortierella sp. NVP41]
MVSISHTHTTAAIHSDDDDGDQSPQPIISHSQNILSHFLTKTFPNLETLSALGWISLSLPGLFSLVRTMFARPQTFKNLALDMNRPPEAAQRQILGLCPLDDQLGKDDILINVIFYNEPFALLREDASVLKE